MAGNVLYVHVVVMRIMRDFDEVMAAGATTAGAGKSCPAAGAAPAVRMAPAAFSSDF